MSTPEPHGIEAQVCADIASRQKLGMSKYGTSVADNPLTETQWLQHAYEEALDLSIYLKRIVEMKTTSPASHRPFNLPPEFFDPPAPPAGMRGVYRGKSWNPGRHCWYSPVNQFSGVWEGVCRSIPQGFKNNHYVEYIPLRPVPEGLPPVPEGFEYWGFEKDGLTYPYKGDGLSFDIIVLRNGKWDETGWVNGYNLHCALRIGSELHHRNFDAEEDTAPQFRFFKDADGTRWKFATIGKIGSILRVGDERWEQLPPFITAESFSKLDREEDTIETDADGNPLTVAEIPVTEQPAKAREWDVVVGNNGKLYDPLSYLGTPAIKVREVIPGEADLLAEAVGHLRDVTDKPEAAMPHSKALEWLSTNFPQPEPEPFDMDKLWASVPAWHDWIAMDDDGHWKSFEHGPKVCVRRWGTISGNSIQIPYNLAPPRAADWENSLVKRPTPASHE